MEGKVENNSGYNKYMINMEKQRFTEVDAPGHLGAHWSSDQSMAVQGGIANDSVKEALLQQEYMVQQRVSVYS
jgi:hypothetical protein